MRIEALGNGLTMNHKLGLFLFLSALFLQSTIKAEDVSFSTFSLIAQGRRPQLSVDGQWIVFESDAALVPEDQDKTFDIYMINRLSNEVKLIDGDRASSHNLGPTLSGNNKWVTYHTRSSLPNPDMLPQTSDIVLFQLSNNRAQKITIGNRDEVHDGEALYSTLDYDARLILYTSNAGNLVPHIDPPVRGIYLHDRLRSATVLLTRSADGESGNRPSGNPRMNKKATTIAFISAATNLTDIPLPKDSLTPHLYLLERPERRIEQIDTFEKGFDGKAWVVIQFDMSADGEKIVFAARHRMPGQPYKSMQSTDLFLYEKKTGKVRLLTTGIFAKRASSPALSGNGRYLAFALAPEVENKKGKGGLVVVDLEKDIWRQMVEGEASNPVFSEDGCVLAFDSVTAGGSDGKYHARSVFTIDLPFPSE